MVVMVEAVEVGRLLIYRVALRVERVVKARMEVELLLQATIILVVEVVILPLDQVAV
jgi:hypothetical protein